MSTNDEKIENQRKREYLSKELDNFTFYNRQIPKRMRGGIIRYIVDRIPPGDFLTSVMTNDLKRAITFADDENMWIIPVYIAFFYNKVPSSIYGNKENFNNHLERRDIINED